MARHPEHVMWSEGDVIKRRIAAAVLDGFIIVLPAVTLMSRGTLIESGVYLFHISFFVWFIYGLWFEWLFGQTLGKMAFGIVVAKKDGSQCGLRSSVIRNFIRYLDILLFYGVGFVFMLATERYQRIGDYFAGTVVLRAA